MTLRNEIDKILEQEFFKKYNIPVTYSASNSIIYKTVQCIDELAQASGKGFCLRTANKIKNKINESGQEVSKETS